MPSTSRSPRMARSAMAVGSVDLVGPARWQPARGERGDVAVEPGGVPGTLQVTVRRMRTRAQGQVRTTAPVQQVVPALVSGTGQIGDLVAPQASHCGQLVCQQLHLGRALLGLLRCCTRAPRVCTPGDRQMVAIGARQALGIRIVQRERVGREVLRGQGQHGCERGPPRVQALTGDVGQQVETDRVEPGRACRLDGGYDVAGTMTPSQPLQLPVLHRLRTDREPVHTGRAEARQVTDLIGTGVGLQADLGMGRDPQARIDRVEQASDLRGLHERGGATAQVDARQRWSCDAECLIQPVCTQVQLTADRGQQ